jgi:hypothetical protein
LADNVAVTAGSGTLMATDERTIAAATVHVQRVGEIGAAAGAVGQTTISNSSTAIAAARDTRKSILIVNYQTVPIFIDVGGTATTADFRLDPGASVTIFDVVAINAITAAAYTAVGDAKVHYIEVYD